MFRLLSPPSFSSEPVAFAFEDDHLGVVDQAVDHGRHRHRVPEVSAQAEEALVGADDQRAPFVAGGDQREEEGGGLGVEGEVLGRGQDALRLSGQVILSPHAEPDVARSRASGSPYVHGGVDVFAGSPDECNVVVSCPTEACSCRVDFVDVAGVLIWAPWHRLGLPRTVQLDNHTNFRSAIPPRSSQFGHVVAACLDLGVTLRFIRLREQWRNAVVERFEDTWERLFFRTTRFVRSNGVLDLWGHKVLFEPEHTFRYALPPFESGPGR